MTAANLALAAVLLLTLAGGMWRVARGPGVADRLQAALLFGTTGTAALIVLAEAMDVHALRHVALVFALLASVVTAAFLRRRRTGDAHG
ncbi:MAG TPA: monovalent cation/H+ antiporter complex subunit F [Miltoncostaeaceae bacterium]|nr:monovalent cation/H+ antiporter complex subunit F [Miltoncostaeaceae bacterium]